MNEREKFLLSFILVIYPPLFFFYHVPFRQENSYSERLSHLPKIRKMAGSLTLGLSLLSIAIRDREPQPPSIRTSAANPRSPELPKLLWLVCFGLLSWQKSGTRAEAEAARQRQADQRYTEGKQYESRLKSLPCPTGDTPDHTSDAPRTSYPTPFSTILLRLHFGHVKTVLSSGPLCILFHLHIHHYLTNSLCAITLECKFQEGHDLVFPFITVSPSPDL